MYQYLKGALELFDKVMKNNHLALSKAIKLFKNAQKNNQKIFIFGSGHSHLMAEELFFRAGSIPHIQPILIEELMPHKGAVAMSQKEKKLHLINKYLKDYHFDKNDIMVIISNSGRNLAQIDMAFAAKKRGLKTIALTSKKLNKGTKTHPSKLFLKDICDLVIDSCISNYDLALEYKNYFFGSYSTLIGILIMQILLTESIKALIDENKKVEIFQSGNKGQKENPNQDLILKMKKTIKFI